MTETAAPELHAFELRDEYRGTVGESSRHDHSQAPPTADHAELDAQPVFQGATFFFGDGEMFDVGEALDEGKGRIVTDDPHLADKLEQQMCLERVPVQDGDSPNTDPLAGMTRAKLLEQPEVAQIDGANSLRVAALRDAVGRVRRGLPPFEPEDDLEAVAGDAGGESSDQPEQEA